MDLHKRQWRSVCGTNFCILPTRGPNFLRKKRSEPPRARKLCEERHTGNFSAPNYFLLAQFPPGKWLPDDVLERSAEVLGCPLTSKEGYQRRGTTCFRYKKYVDGEGSGQTFEKSCGRPWWHLHRQCSYTLFNLKNCSRNFYACFVVVVNSTWSVSVCK